MQNYNVLIFHSITDIIVNVKHRFEIKNYWKKNFRIEKFTGLRVRYVGCWFVLRVFSYNVTILISVQQF